MPNTMLPTRRKFVRGALASATALAVAGCKPAAVPRTHTPPGPDVSGAQSLRAHATSAKLFFGFSVATDSLRNDFTYRQVVEQQANLVVPDDALDWRVLRRSATDFNFDPADAIVAITDAARIKLRGNTLCPNDSLPDWFGTSTNRSNALQLLTGHIRTVVGRYAGRAHSWDVVREVIDLRDGRIDGLRNSPWLLLVGTDYIETAFRTAREADPTALLSYSESGLEPETALAATKRASTLLLLRRLKQRNVPIDAIAIQSRIRAAAPSGRGLQQFINSCRELGLEVFLSEFSVDDRVLPGPNDLRDNGVADAYADYLALTLASPNVTAVLTAGVDDSQSSLSNGATARADRRPQRPLLFDSTFRPKPAFAAVRSAFDKRGIALVPGR